MEGGHRGLAWRKGPFKPGDRESLTVAAAGTATRMCEKLCATHCPEELSPMQSTVRKIRSVTNLKSKILLKSHWTLNDGYLGLLLIATLCSNNLLERRIEGALKNMEDIHNSDKMFNQYLLKR